MDVDFCGDLVARNNDVFKLQSTKRLGLEIPLIIHVT